MTDHAALRRAAHQFLHTADRVESKVLPSWILAQVDDVDQIIQIRNEMTISGVANGREFVTWSRPIPTPTPGAQ